MSISVDTINLRFNVKPDYDQQQLQQLQEDLKNGQKELEKTRKAMDKLAKNGLNAMTKEERKEFDRLSESLTKTAREVHENEQKMKEFTRTANISKMSLQQLGQRAKDLTAVLNNLNPETDDFKEYKKELDAVKERMKELRGVADNTKSSLQSFVEGFNHFGFAITNILAIKDRIVQWADQYVQSFAQMDEAMTDVMKYTGQTKREVEEMNETFKRMETRTAREELNALAGAAGRLGITARKDIEGFVDAADKINVALGDDLGEGAIDQIGKLTMVFGEDKTKGLNGAMLATGSAINVLGANSSASTGFITEFTSAMAGMAVNARISQTDIMGYASALSQAGVEGQTASGVFAQMITKMFTDPAKFARAARLDVKQFTDLLKTDANQAILQFLDGLRQNGGFDALAPALKSLKMQGTQAVPVISSLINKMDELRSAQATAAKAYDEGTSIIEEFENANSSAAAKLEIAKKRLNDVSVELGQKLMPIVEGSITATTSLLKIITPLTTFIASNIKTVVQLTLAIAAYNVAANASAISTSRLAVSIKGALVATRQWFAALSANPIGMVAAAVTLLATEVYSYVSRAREASKIQEQLNEAMTDAKKEASAESTELEQLAATVRSTTVSEDDRKRALSELNGKLMAQHLGNLTEEQVRTGDLTKILDEYNRRLETRIRLEKLQQQQKDLISQKIDIEEGGYKDDISWLDRFNQGVMGVGQVLISGHTQGIGAAWDQATGQMEESFKQRALRPVLEGLESVEQKITDIRNQENQIHQIGEVVITPGKATVPNASASGDEEDEKEARKAANKRKEQRKQLEAEAKQAYEREKIELRQQYQGKKNLQDEWHEKEYQAEQRYIDRLAQIRTTHNASEADRMEVANMQLDSITREANRRQEMEKRRQAERLQQIDLQQGAAEIALARQRLDGEVGTQKEYNDRKLQLEIDYQRQRVALLKEGSAEYQQAMKQLLQMEQTQADQQRQSARQGKQQYQQGMNTFLHGQMADMSSFDEMTRLNEQFYEQGRISYEQYQQNLTEIAQKEETQRQQIQQAAMDGAQQLLNSASSLFQAMQQRETSAVDAKYKKMIAAAKKQGKDTAKLEEQQELEKAAIKKKYADRQFKIQVLQIVANTAQGISKTIAELGMPWAIPFVAMAAAAGAMQLAAAKASADEAAGLYKGGFSGAYDGATVPGASASGVQGYTKKGNPNDRAGMIPVHKNEFVANHHAVANPQVKPVLDVIDAHQRRGDIQMLNATRLLDEAYGRYQGGYTGPSASNGGPSADHATTSLQPTAADLLPILTRIAENTARSLTVRRLREEISHEEQLERNARR